MGVSLKQVSFAGAVVSPQLRGRTDQVKYATGLKSCSNAWITRYGTIENRPGTVYDVTVKDSTQRLREVPFVFSRDISYNLEVGALYIRPLLNGSYIDLTGSPTWNNVAAYLTGDVVTYLGVVYRALSDTAGDTPASTPLVWNVQSGAILEIITNLPQAALATLQYVQQNDVMTVTSHEVPPQQLLRYSNTRWVFQSFVSSTGVAPPTVVNVVAGNPATTIATPTGLSAVGGVVTLTDTRYSVTAYGNNPNRESIADTFDLVGFTPDPGTPVVLTWSAAAGALGYAIYRKEPTSGIPAGIIGVTNALTFTDALQTTNINGAFPIQSLNGGSPGSGLFTYVVTTISAASGTESLASAPGSATGGNPTTANPNVISWVASADAGSYRVYKNTSGVYGFIGSTATNSFRDDNIIADTSIQPPTAISLFNTPDDYPAVCGYYQQRLMFANTVNQPQSVWASRVGNDYAFTVSVPVQDDDAIQFVIAGRQVQPVQALVDLGKLVIHTANAEYVASGNQAGTLTPAAIGLVANGSAGSQLIAPVVLGNTDLFVQSGSTRILDLRYEVESFSYAGKDLTKFATGLFAGHTIIDMAWQKLPHSIVWVILDNGTMLGLTYIREDELWGWHAHVTTDGAFENVCVVPEGTQQKVYVVVRRTVNGQTKRYIEHLAERECLDTVFFTDSIFSDSSLTYDGRNATATTVTLTAGTGWTPTDTVNVTATAGAFSVGDVGNQVILQLISSETGLVTDVVSVQITGYSSITAVSGTPTRDVPTWARSTPTTDWGKAVKSFTGISHLEGADLSILADGSVVANPLNTALPVITVTGGAFTLTQPALVVTAGLPIQMDVETLPVENATGETIANKRVKVAEITPVFSSSRGGLYGQDAAHLDLWKQPPNARLGYPPPALTGPYRIPIRGTWETTGQVAARVTDPVPWSISAIVVSGEVGN